MFLLPAVRSVSPEICCRFIVTKTFIPHCSVIVVPFVRFLQNVFCASHLPRQVEVLPPEGAEEELPNVLKVQDVPEENAFFQKGLGPNSEMLFGRGPLQDRRLLERILLQGASEFKVAKLVDIYHVVEITGEGESRKRRKNSTLCCQGHVGVCCRFFGFKGQKVANFHEVTLLVPSNKNTRCLPLFLVRHA